MYQEPYRLIKVPANQLKLTEAELKEEHTRVLKSVFTSGQPLLSAWGVLRRP